MTVDALSDLEWPRLTAALASRAVGARGRREALALGRLSGDAWGRARAEVREAMDALAEGDPLPLGALPDVDEALERARIGATLSASELREVAAALDAAARLRSWLAAGRDRRPALHAACACDAGLADLALTLSSSFDATGALADHVTPRLAALRAERGAARTRLIARLEELMRGYEHVLSDSFWTEREGRFVLPLRTDAHERFPGIVHATSASGATLFVEPRALVATGNRLKVLDAEVRREEELALAALTARVADALPEVSFAVAALGRADLRAATARLALDLSLELCDASHPPGLALRALRHPLLALDGVDAVPSDVELGAARALIVSGPNAGGKTVVLKAVGMAALMHGAALPVAASRGSSLGVFDVVLTDIGDDQSLSRNLSTFSAHASRLAEILSRASSGSLVLVDELATGTDPREGEALAAAVIDGLAARGATVVATTHYEGLKALAATDPRLANASVGLDATTLAPTFRLVPGVPGASSALAVARRFGVPAAIVARAESFLAGESHDFQALVASLLAERRKLELAEAAALRAKEDADRRASELQRALDELRAGHEHEALRESARLVESVRRARASLREIEARLRQRRGDDRELQALSRAVDELAGQVALGGALAPRPTYTPASPPPSLELGARVFVPRLSGDAEIVEVLSGRRLRVSAGALRMTVTIDEVRAPSAAAPPARARRGPLPQPSASPLETTAQTREATCDLRGLDAAAATRRASGFIERSLEQGSAVAFFVHGHGTDALRSAIRASLAASHHVRELRPGAPGEGGDGVTVAWLRDR